MVILKDVRHVDLESLVKYMYAGQVYIKQDQLGRFLKTAEALQVKGLAEHPNISSKVEKDEEEEEEDIEEQEVSSYINPLKFDFFWLFMFCMNFFCFHLAETFSEFQ